jgi:hypothetical protein
MPQGTRKGKAMRRGSLVRACETPHGFARAESGYAGAEHGVTGNKMCKTNPISEGGQRGKPHWRG